MSPADSTPGRPDDPEERSPLDWPGEAGKTDAVLRELAVLARRRRRRRLTWGGVLSVCVLAVSGVFWSSLPEPSAPPAPRVAAQTVVLRPEEQVLPDGSRVELRENAVMEAIFSPDVRRIRLTRGDAHFQVAKDASRPFVVEAGGIDVRAVGTAFLVEQGTDVVGIVVTEGVVAVEQPAAIAGGQSRTMALVEAGHRAVIGPGRDTAEITSIRADELNDRLVWRVPRFEFSGTPLDEALLMFNEHNDMQLVMADPVLGRVRLSGIIRADNINALLRLLEDNYGIKAVEHRDGVEIRLGAAR